MLKGETCYACMCIIYVHVQDCGALFSMCQSVYTCSAAEIGQLKDAVQTKARDLDKANKVSPTKSSQMYLT